MELPTFFSIQTEIKTSFRTTNYLADSASYEFRIYIARYITTTVWTVAIENCSFTYTLFVAQVTQKLFVKISITSRYTLKFFRIVQYELSCIRLNGFEAYINSVSEPDRVLFA